MSIWGLLGLIFLVIQFIYEQYNKKGSEIETEDEEITLDSNSDAKEPVILEQSSIGVTRKKKIQDRETEIIGKGKMLTKEQFVKDYIMSEILSKPKSKR